MGINVNLFQHKAIVCLSSDKTIVCVELLITQVYPFNLLNIHEKDRTYSTRWNSNRRYWSG